MSVPDTAQQQRSRSTASDGWYGVAYPESVPDAAQQARDLVARKWIFSSTAGMGSTGTTIRYVSTRHRIAPNATSLLGTA
eukprot:1586608-Rhodomonas_salina.1